MHEVLLNWVFTMASNRSLWYKTLRYIINRYQTHQCAAHAAVLTLDTLLSLVPLMAASIALFSISPKLQTLVIQAEHRLLAHFVVNTGYEIQAYLESISQKAAQVSFIGSLFLLATSIKLLYSLQQAFNTIIQVRVRQKTKFEIGLAWIAWIFAPIIVGLGIGMSSYIISMPLFAKHSHYLKPLLSFIPISLSTIAFRFLYGISSIFVVSSRYAWYGAICAACLFELSKWLFGLYILHFANYKLLYGVLAAIPLFILWLYISWQIVLLGAVLAQALAYKERYRSYVSLDGFTHAVVWLGYFWQAAQKNQQLSLSDLVVRDRVSYQIEPESMLTILISLGLVSVSNQGYYVLERDITQLSVLDYLELLPWKLPSVKRLAQIDFSYRDNLIAVLAKIENARKAHLNKPLISLYKA